MELINEIPANELLSYGMMDVMKRIIEECGGEKKEFRIKRERRPGNHWNSTIDGIYMSNGRLCVDVYVQNSSTDTNTSEYYRDLLTSTETGWVDSRLGHVSYFMKDKAEAVRAILSEYVYYKYLEVDEREHARKISELTHYSILNPILNHYYEEWRCKYQGGYPGAPHDRLDRYHRCDNALRDYIKTHVDELYGKSKEELSKIYRSVWEMESEK